jgi:hypothetical protein
MAGRRERNGVMMITTLAALCVAHFLCDYPLQGDWLSKAKNHKNSLVPNEQIWPLCLAGHALIHAAAVFLILSSLPLAIAEFVIHAATDYAKCDGRIGYNTDQYIHLACKVVWWVFAFSVGLSQ